MKIKIANKDLFEDVRNNGMKCLCTVEETNCICEEFENQTGEGLCHCGVYEKVKPLIVYTTGCPRCEILKDKMIESNVYFTEVEDIEKMKELGIKQVPILEVNGKLLSYFKALEYIKGL